MALACRLRVGLRLSQGGSESLGDGMSVSVKPKSFSGAPRAGKMVEFEGAPQVGEYGLAPNIKDSQ